MGNARSEVLVTAAELMRWLTAGEPLTILDVRWHLMEPDGFDAYTRGHLPGAVYASLEDDLADHTVAGRGRHPLPSGGHVEAAARRWGIRSGVPIVVYDDWNRAGSARAWWVLTAAGISGVRILDGGLSAWTASGGALEMGSVTPEPGDVTVSYDDLYNGGLPTVTAEQAAGFDGLLLDARAPERYRGEVEPVDPVPGHVPGAHNAPSTGVLAADGTFLTEDDLTRYFHGHGVDAAADRVGVYCGSGVTAAVTIAALRTAGVPAGLFPGSWSEWVSDPARPVALGSGESGSGR